MIGFEVASRQLRASAGVTDEVAQRARNQIARLRAEVDELLGAGWRGPASAGFAAGWRRWHEAAADLVTQLQAMADLLAETGHEYASAETGSTRTIAGAGGGW